MLRVAQSVARSHVPRQRRYAKLCWQSHQRTPDQAPVCRHQPLSIRAGRACSARIRVGWGSVATCRRGHSSSFSQWQRCIHHVVHREARRSSNRWTIAGRHAVHRKPDVIAVSGRGPERMHITARLDIIAVRGRGPVGTQFTARPVRGWSIRRHTECPLMVTEFA